MTKLCARNFVAGHGIGVSPSLVSGHVRHHTSLHSDSISESEKQSTASAKNTGNTSRKDQPHKTMRPRTCKKCLDLPGDQKCIRLVLVHEHKEGSKSDGAVFTLAPPHDRLKAKVSYYLSRSVCP